MGADDLVISEHMLDRAQRRNIPEVAVRAVVADADGVIERDDGRTEYTGVWQGRRLTVVVDEAVEPPRVVTVFDLGRGGRP